MNEALTRMISGILKHDRKVASYKIALLRAINDVALTYPDLATHGKPIAIPLDTLAEQWIAYYWPFADPNAPLLQGVPQAGKHDIAFRPQLAAVRQQWQLEMGDSVVEPSDGFFLVNEMRIRRKRETLSPALRDAYRTAVGKIRTSIRQPIRYAGPDSAHYRLFAQPRKLADSGNVVAVPGTRSHAYCLLISAELWRTFQSLSLWVEALCIHEWCLLSEQFDAHNDRGDIYRLLTARPDNRRPLTWERNQVDILLLEGNCFTCPWTRREIRHDKPYDIDHIIPLAVYPANDLWNLLPTDSAFNRHKKRDRLPSTDTLRKAQTAFAGAYRLYSQTNALSEVLQDDVRGRFSQLSKTHLFPDAVAQAVVTLVETVAKARHVARF